MMGTRIVEVAQDKRHLSKVRGFLQVESGGDSLGRVPFDELAAVIANAHGLSYTNNLLVALAEQGIPFVLCKSNHNVAAMLLPVDGHHRQAKRFDAQAHCKKSVRKRLWQQIVRAKLRNQASVLRHIGASEKGLMRLAEKTRSGDPENCEAQGARQYWPLLFGSDFRRDRSAGGANQLLNYGYTILRAATARAVVAAGLHPTLGLHHANEGNPMRLVDDLMEPYRPLIDLMAYRIQEARSPDVDRDTKTRLVNSLYVDWTTSQGTTPTIGLLNRLSLSLASVFLGETDCLSIVEGVPVVKPFAATPVEC